MFVHIYIFIYTLVPFLSRTCIQVGVCAWTHIHCHDVKSANTYFLFPWISSTRPGGTDFVFLHLHCMDQLYCIARALGTTMCTVHCDASLEQVKNLETSPHRHMRPLFFLQSCFSRISACDISWEQIGDFNKCSSAYEERHIVDLPMRYERPNDRNRWERCVCVCVCLCVCACMCLCLYVYMCVRVCVSGRGCGGVFSI